MGINFFTKVPIVLKKPIQYLKYDHSL